MSPIRGHEHAPLITWTREGTRPPTAEEARAFNAYTHADGSVGAVGALIHDGEGRHTRRLMVADPMDQREIWRLAALALGANRGSASRAILDVWDLPPSGRMQWALGHGQHRHVVVEGADLTTATAALCAAVWGVAEQPAPP